VATFDDEVRRCARSVAAGPTEALAIAKALMNQSAGMDRLDAHLDLELDHLSRIADGSEFAEGLEGFFARRPPQFAKRA
jgi:enoyl-CoA hydratase/carnithine racemase